tara:strand:+ start:195 stop:404 length:210 start_codon:yes stop_codon:yes gene_type:complete
MKWEIGELDFVKECVFSAAIKGKDSIFVAGVIQKIYKEVDRLKAQAVKKQQMEPTPMKQVGEEVFIKDK